MGGGRCSRGQASVSQRFSAIAPRKASSDIFSPVAPRAPQTFTAACALGGLARRGSAFARGWARRGADGFSAAPRQPAPRPRAFRGALRTSPLLASRPPAGRRVWSPPRCHASSCAIPGWRRRLPQKLHSWAGRGAGAPPEPPRPRFVGTMLNRDLSRQGRPWKPSEPGGGERTSKGGRTSLSVRKCF